MSPIIEVPNAYRLFRSCPHVVRSQGSAGSSAPPSPWSGSSHRLRPPRAWPVRRDDPARGIGGADCLRGRCAAGQRGRRRRPGAGGDAVRSIGLARHPRTAPNGAGAPVLERALGFAITEQGPIVIEDAAPAQSPGRPGRSRLHLEGAHQRHIGFGEGPSSYVRIGLVDPAEAEYTAGRRSARRSRGFRRAGRCARCRALLRRDGRGRQCRDRYCRRFGGGRRSQWIGGRRGRRDRRG